MLDKRSLTDQTIKKELTEMITVKQTYKPGDKSCPMNWCWRKNWG